MMDIGSIVTVLGSIVVALLALLGHAVAIRGEMQMQRRRERLRLEEEETRTPAISREVQEEIDQAPAWWDREYARLLREVEPPSTDPRDHVGHEVVTAPTFSGYTRAYCTRCDVEIGSLAHGEELVWQERSDARIADAERRAAARVANAEARAADLVRRYENPEDVHDALRALRRSLRTDWP